MAGPPPRVFLFQDAIICGMIGGAVAWALGEPFTLWAMLSALAGPLVILAASRALDALPFALPYREEGAHEFAVFAVLAALAVLLWKIAGD